MLQTQNLLLPKCLWAALAVSLSAATMQQPHLQAQGQGGAPMIPEQCLHRLSGW